MGRPKEKVGDKIMFLFLAITSVALFGFGIAGALVLGYRYGSPALAGFITLFCWGLAAILAGLAEGFQ